MSLLFLVRSGAFVAARSPALPVGRFTLADQHDL